MPQEAWLQLEGLCICVLQPSLCHRNDVLKDEILPFGPSQPSRMITRMSECFLGQHGLEYCSTKNKKQKHSYVDEEDVRLDASGLEPFHFNCRLIPCAIVSFEGVFLPVAAGLFPVLFRPESTSLPPLAAHLQFARIPLRTDCSTASAPLTSSYGPGSLEKPCNTSFIWINCRKPCDMDLSSTYHQSLHRPLTAYDI